MQRRLTGTSTQHQQVAANPNPRFNARKNNAILVFCLAKHPALSV